MNFLRTRPRVAAGLISFTALSGMIAYLGKRRLDKSCRRISVAELPRSSACRNLVERTGKPISQHAWGLERSTLLAPWAGISSAAHTLWVPSYAALQVEVPIAQLRRYGISRGVGDETAEEAADANYLMQSLVAAFLDARAAGPEAFFLDEEVPPLSFAPSTFLFGNKNNMGAFMLGTWSSVRGMRPQPLLTELPAGAPLPVSEFPSNSDVIRDSSTDVAGAVMYWRFPQGMVNAADTASVYGFPCGDSWRADTKSLLSRKSRTTLLE